MTQNGQKINAAQNDTFSLSVLKSLITCSSMTFEAGCSFCDPNYVCK